METLIGFAIGYLVGTRQGRDGLEKMMSSLDAIRNSPEVKQMLVVGAATAGSAAKQVLGGTAGTALGGALGGALSALTKQVTEMAQDTERRARAA